MEQRSLHSHTGKDLWWNTTEIRDHNTHWCQRKSGWCAFSCHKCIDVRHRHSSPLSTEWLALGFFVYFYFFKSFFVLFKKMSQCKKQVGWPPARFEQLTLDVCVFICEVWKYQSCCCFSSFSSVLGWQEGSRCSLFRGQNLCRQQQQLAYNQYMRLNKISTEFKVNTVCFKCLKISNRSMLQPLVPCSCHITRNTRVKIKRLGRQSESRLEIWTRDLLTQSKTATLQR